MGVRQFRRFPHEGGPYAVTRQLVADDEGLTLCGAPATIACGPHPAFLRSGRPVGR
ncbi:hypothetical protein JOF41_001346 [Saccharothrix coeruleofusca]|nr:hypothetical protein [Saccharothrix coeruleofusca]